MKNYIGASILISLVVFLVYLPKGDDLLTPIREQARAASSIVVGDVTNQISYFGTDGEVYSDVTVQVNAVLKEDRAKGGGLLTFTVKGGVVGDTHVVFSDEPQFAVDEAVMVFMDGGRVREKYQVRDGMVPQLGEKGSAVLDAIEKTLDKPILESERRSARKFMEDSRTTKATNQPDQERAAAADAACYTLIGPKWTDSVSTYKIGASIPAAWKTALTSSATSWSDAGTAFKFKADAASTNEFLVGTVSSAQTLASTRVEYDSTMKMRKFTMTFSNAVQWSTSGEGGKYDVESVTTHELGHALGLTHPSGSACSEQTMWATADAAETKKRSLEAGDKGGLKALYVAVAAPAPIPPLVTAPVPAPPPAPVAPAPAFTTTYIFPAVPKAGESFTLWMYGANFNVTNAQAVIQGPACPSGCVVTPSTKQATLLSATVTLSAKGSYSIAVRNGATGAASVTKPLTIQ